MGRRLLPAAFVVLAAVADSSGAHAVALDALLGAVPFAAVSSITAFGDYLDRRGDPVVGLQAFLWAVVLALLVLSCAIRSGSIHGVPPLAVSSLVAALAILGLKAVVHLAPYARRLAELLPAKP